MHLPDRSGRQEKEKAPDSDERGLLMTGQDRLVLFAIRYPL
jgi:hypothetical protein